MLAGLLAGIVSSSGGGGGGTPSTTNRTVSNFAGGVGTITATYTISSDGNVYDHTPTNLEQWLPDGLTASDYQVRATLSSGDTPTGTLNTWLALSQSWSQVANAGQTKSCVLTIQLRDAASPFTVHDSSSITITADNGG